MRAIAPIDVRRPGLMGPRLLVLTTRLGPLPLAVALGLYESGFSPVLVQMGNTKSGGLSGAIRAYGWRYVISQAIDSVWRRIWMATNARAANRLPVIRVAARNWEALDKIARRHSAAAIISASFKHRIPARFIDAQPFLLNLHPAPLPEWRGADPIWWMRRGGSHLFGVTLHRVAKRIDEGDILFSGELPSRRRGLTQASIECALASLVRGEIGCWMQAILEGRAECVTQVGGNYWPLPTKANVRAVKSDGGLQRR